jgi:hypothetical protein
MGDIHILCKATTQGTPMVWDEMTEEVDHTLRVLKMARECGFREIETQLLDDLQAVSDQLLMGATATDGKPRGRCAAR